MDWQIALVSLTLLRALRNQELITYFQSRITERNPVLREFFFREKLSRNLPAYQKAVSDGREALLKNVIIE